MKISFNAARATLIDFDPTIVKNIKNRCLAWSDKSIEMANRLGKGRYRDPIRYCLDDDNTFPSGLIPAVCDYLYKVNLKPELIFEYKPFTLANPEPNPDWLYPHQHDIINNFLEYRRCCISSPTASGKSTVISAVVDKFKGYQVLVVLHQIDLILDLANDIEEYIEEPVGVIGDGKSDIKRVTVASSRSLYNHSKGKYKNYLESIDLLIFDEAHHYANATGEAISNACVNTSYRLGLSATLRIETGAGIVLEGVIGPTTLVVPESVVIEQGLIHKPEVYFVEVEDPKVKLPLKKIGSDLKPERSEVVRACIIENDARNALIARIANMYNEYSNGVGSALIIVEDVLYRHSERIQEEMLEYGLAASILKGESKTDERQAVIKEFKDKAINFLIATRILNEGKDIPNLELVINAAGGSGERGITQKTGRALRLDRKGSKTGAIVIDFLDNEPYYLHSNSLSRMRYLNKRYDNCCKVVTEEELYEILKNKQ